MSDIWLPPSERTPVKIQQKQRVCVLIHNTTKRILCFAMDDWFADQFAAKGYVKVPIMHAHEYDMYAQRIRDQAKEENEAEDYAHLERENAVRKRLRAQLEDVVRSSTKPVADRKAASDALHCMEIMEKRRRRYRDESFFAQEAYDEKKNAGEEIVNKIMVPK